MNLSLLRLALPIFISYFFLSISYALFAKGEGGGVWVANEHIVLLSVFVFAGAAQFITVELLRNNLPALEIIFSALIVNLRMSVYSFTFLPKIKELSFFKKISILIGITDENYILFNLHKTKSWSYRDLVLVVFLCYFFWNLGTWIGTFFLNSIPEVIEKNTHALYYLLFIILLYESIRQNMKYVFLVGLTIFFNFLLTFFLNEEILFLNLIVGSGLGALVYTWFDSRGVFKKVAK